jgi:hypothetical protein
VPITPKVRVWGGSSVGDDEASVGEDVAGVLEVGDEVGPAELDDDEPHEASRPAPSTAAIRARLPRALADLARTAKP